MAIALSPPNPYNKSPSKASFKALRFSRSQLQKNLPKLKFFFQNLSLKKPKFIHVFLLCKKTETEVFNRLAVKS